MEMLWPSTKPVSRKPCRNASSTYTESSGDRLLKNPITGIAGCCARAASGHAAAAPPSRNSRRLMSDMGACFPRLVPMKRSQGITERTAGPWATPEVFWNWTKDERPLRRLAVVKGAGTRAGLIPGGRPRERSYTTVGLAWYAFRSADPQLGGDQHGSSRPDAKISSCVGKEAQGVRVRA